MSSLFLVNQSLESLFEKLEENGGELTPELEKELEIKQELLESTLISYKEAIQNYEASIDLASIEYKRIAAFKKSKQSRIDRLKNQIVYAIKKFGFINKNGKMTISLPTATFTTRYSTSIEYMQERADILVDSIKVVIVDAFYDKNIYFENTGITIESISNLVDMINNFAKEKYYNIGKEFIPYTIDDVLNINLNMSITSNFEDFLKKGFGSFMAKHISCTNLSDNTSKTYIKKVLDVDESFKPDLTIARISYNDNLVIK